MVPSTYPDSTLFDFAVFRLYFLSSVDGVERGSSRKHYPPYWEEWSHRLVVPSHYIWGGHLLHHQVDGWCNWSNQETEGGGPETGEIVGVLHLVTEPAEFCYRTRPDTELMMPGDASLISRSLHAHAPLIAWEDTSKLYKQRDSNYLWGRQWFPNLFYS